MGPGADKEIASLGFHRSDAIVEANGTLQQQSGYGLY